MSQWKSALLVTNTQPLSDNSVNLHLSNWNLFDKLKLKQPHSTALAKTDSLI